MTRERLTIPERNVREYAHGLAYRLACEKLAGIADIEQQCRRSGARYLSAEKSVTIDHLNCSYKISVPHGEISLVNSEEAVPIRDKILILHYFTRAGGTPLTGRIITYKELHEGINYYPTFFKRAIDPIINHFRDKPQKLLEVAKIMGGGKADYGDIAVTIYGFPRVPVTIVLWSGDNEFAPDGNIMFDSTIPDYLPTEDITILCEIIAWRLVKLSKTGGDNPG
jgi:hypothetical protein